MTREEFTVALAGRFETGFAEKYGKIVDADSMHILCMELVFDGNPSVAFHAAYALEAAFFIDPAGFAARYGERFLADYLLVTNPSAHRHYTKMLAYMLAEGLVEVRAAGEAEGLEPESGLTDGFARQSRQGSGNPYVNRESEEAGREELIAEKTFDLLISDKTRPAVKVWAMEILYLLSADIEWIGPELYETIMRQMEEPDAGAGFRNRAAKVCKRLRKKLDL